MEADMINIDNLRKEIGVLSDEVGNLHDMIADRDTSDLKPEYFSDVAKIVAAFRVEMLMARAGLALKLAKHDKNAVFDADQERRDDARFGTYAEQHRHTVRDMV
jgi:hypothetical protein